MKYSIIVIISLFAVTPTWAQNKDISNEEWQQFTNGKAQFLQTKSSRNVEGSPFFNDDWETGFVMLKSGKKSNNAYLKYDAYNNQLLFKTDGKVLAVIPKRMNGFVLLDGNKQIVFKKGFKSPENDISPNRLLRIIYNGAVKVVAKNYVRLHKSNGPNPLTGEVTDTFIPKKDYYLITADNEFHKIKLKKDDILDALSSHKNELKAYARAKNLDFGKEQDLKKILREYDKMLEGDQ